ncbi:hypothetical protein AK812_SmicGene49125 [Symbiodinium microadriaticum]|uniref:Uncharacterized protein n=1 Tax=Symbiodinium microadriaticum TaxID=2951 RepID=A0A1Q9EER7_SYMMI|nr:hypothetical protein AK812_SmicGene49125 [Symbiodinium microadriaticum]
MLRAWRQLLLPCNDEVMSSCTSWTLARLKLEVSAGTTTKELIVRAMKLRAVLSEAEVNESIHGSKGPQRSTWLSSMRLDAAAYAKIHQELMQPAEKTFLSTCMAPSWRMR